MVKIFKQDGTPQGAPSAPETPGLAGLPTLDTLAPGQGAVIAGIVAEAGLKMHLMELGFVAGSPITFLMSTPFGDPHIYSLRGTSIALRKSEARCIRITK